LAIRRFDENGMSKMKQPKPELEKDWVDVDRGGQMALARLIGANQRAGQVAAVLVALVGFGNCVYISHSEIGAALGCHPRTVGRALKYLVQNKWVVARKAEFGSSDLYTLNSHLVWSGKREFLKMSKLKDPLMIGGQEQPFLVKLPRSEWARPRREVEGNTGRPDDPRQADGTRAMVRWGPTTRLRFEAARHIGRVYHPGQSLQP